MSGNMRANSLRFILLLSLSLMPLSCRRVADQSLDKSIQQGNYAGWYLNLTVGMVSHKDDTRAVMSLNRYWQELFRSGIGGRYSLGFSLSDSAEAFGVPRSQLMSGFQRVKEEISRYRQSNADGIAQVFMTITAHGTRTDRGYAVILGVDSAKKHEMLSGTELGEALGGLGANEVILVLQSCAAGKVVQGNDSPNELEPYNKDYPISAIAAEALKKLDRAAIISPVSERLRSDKNVWEVILESTTSELINSRGTVLYGDWRNGIIQKSCESFHYTPKVVFESNLLDVSDGAFFYGIDPSFVEKLPSGTVMFDKSLRGSNRSHFASNAGSNLAPDDDLRLSPSAEKACREGKERALRYWRLSSPQEMISFFQTLKFDEEKRKFIRDMLFRKAASSQVKLAALERICASTGGELKEQCSQMITKISLNSGL